MKTSLIALLLIFLFQFKSMAENSKIQFQTSKEKSPVIYVNVLWQILSDHKTTGYAASNEKGEIQLPIAAGEKIILSASCIGYRSIKDTITLQELTQIEMQEDVLNLEQVTVTGTRTPHSLKEAPVLTQVIGEGDLESIDSEVLTDVLQVEMPGIEMARHGGVPVMNMMGMENQYSLVLVDGVRMAKSLQKSVDFTRINTADIERVEVVRGASSALYGSDAMGGVVNIITKKNKKNFSISADIRYQERNQKNHTQNDLDNADGQYQKDFYKNQDRSNLNGNLSIGFKKNNFSSKTFLNYKSVDGYQLYNTEAVKRYYEGIGKVVKEELVTTASSSNGYRDYTLNQVFSYQKNRWKFHLKGTYFEHDEYDFTLDGIHERYKSHTAHASANYTINKKSQLSLSNSMDDYLRFYVDEKADREEKSHDNLYNTTKLTYVGEWKEHKILAELENLYQTLDSDKFKTDQVTQKSSNNSVLVLQDEFKLNDQASLVAGIRAGFHSTYDFHWSPSLNLKYQLGMFGMRFSYSRGFRSPDLKELYFNWSHFGMFEIHGNTDLEPETNDYFSYSIDFVNGNKNLNATLIASYNNVHDKIDGIWTNNETIYSYQNFDNAKVYTVEALLKWKFLKHFKLKGGYIYNKTEKSADGQDLSTMSPMALTAQLQYHFAKKKYRFSANISGKVTGKKDVISQDTDEESPYNGEYYTVKYPTYSIWNLDVNQHFGRHFKLKMGLKNLFDYKAPVVSFNSNYTPGRRFYVTVGYNF